MDLTDYQSLAARTLGRDRTREQQIANAALGLAGEAGEVADHIKKHLFHDFALDEAEVVKELGDCLWYVAAMCTTLGISMDHVATTNIEKLKRRYPDGFSTEASRNRVE